MEMKKSTIYKRAQIAVLDAEFICEYDKLEILRELMSAEDLALFCEEEERKKAE